MPSAAAVSPAGCLLWPGQPMRRSPGLAPWRRRLVGRSRRRALPSSPPATGPGEGAVLCAAEGGSPVVAGMTAACGEAAAAFCRAIEPVTESSPCSSTVTREYSRSRSLLSVSTAETSRRVSLWLSLAACRGWRPRPAQIGRRSLLAPPSNRRLAGEQRDNHRADRGRAPGPEPPQRRPAELNLLGQKSGQHAAGI